ncbi:deSI protein [Trifolium repens]|nr:deSI protein [Trifolium repens]
MDPIKSDTILNKNNNIIMINFNNFKKEKKRVIKELNLNSTMKNATKTNTILKDLIDLKNGIISFFGSTIRYIIYMQYHIRHLFLSNPPTKSQLDSTPLHLFLYKP